MDLCIIFVTFPIKCKINRTSSAWVMVVMNTHPALAHQSFKNSKKEDKSTAFATFISINKEIKVQYKILTISPQFYLQM